MLDQFFTEFVGVTEFPSDPVPHLMVTGNEGCYNNTDLPKTSITTGKDVICFLH